MTLSLTDHEITALQAEFESAHPRDILHWAAQTFGQRLVVVTSLQPTGIVTLHMLSKIAPQTPIVTLDTGLLFAETYALIDAIEARLKLKIQRVQPALSVSQQAQQYGERLWERQPDTCCDLRKTRPLANTLPHYAAWITGLRRDQGVGRAQVPVISRDSNYGLVKLSPLATWTESQVWDYLDDFELPYNALHDQHYPSIGCQPCTQPVSPGEDARSGRWVGRAKTECGIHVELVQAPPARLSGSRQ